MHLAASQSALTNTPISGCTPKAVTHQFTALRKEIDQLKSGDLPTASPKTPTNVGKKRKAKKEDDDGNESPSPSPAKKAKAKATPKKGAAGAAGKKGATGTGKKAKQAVEEGAGDEGESGEMGEDGDGDVAARKDAADGKVKDEVEVEDEGESEGVDAGDE